MPSLSKSLQQGLSVVAPASLQQAHSAIQVAALSAVGKLGLIEAIRALRKEMVECALRQGNGSRRAAARLLGVTRPAIQSVLRQSTLSDQDVK